MGPQGRLWKDRDGSPRVTAEHESTNVPRGPGWDYSFLSDGRVKTQQHFPWTSREMFDPVILRGLQGCSPTLRGLPVRLRENAELQGSVSHHCLMVTAAQLWEGRCGGGLTRGAVETGAGGCVLRAAGAGEGQQKQAMALAGVTQLHPRRPPAAPSPPHSTQVNLLDSFVHGVVPDMESMHVRGVYPGLTWMG